MHTGIPIAGVFVGCAVNVFFLEVLVKNDPGVGNLITFTNFVFISVVGIIFTAKFGKAKRYIGLKDYFILVALFFATSVFNNLAFDFNIPMPLHMIFRAGSLIANMVMGIIIMNKKYTLSKYVSVLMITIGIAICTIISSQEVKSTAVNVEIPTTPYEDYFWWTIGIALLTLALFISARMGLYQEYLFSKYGKHPQEALLYAHMLPLPLFLPLYRNLYDHGILMMKTAPVEIPGMGISLPIMALYLIGNILSQYLCISCVYRLTTECSSLTVTLVLTLRKFTSLVFSIIYFKNPFTWVHWAGTILVFMGTLIFTEVPDKIAQSLQQDKKKPKGKKSKSKVQ